MSQWYYNDSGKVVGPCSADDIRLMHKHKKITDTTFVWCEGMAGWVTYAEAAAKFEPSKPAAPAAPTGMRSASTEPAPVVESSEDAPKKSALAGIKETMNVPGDELITKALEFAGANEMPGEGTCPACGYYIGSGLTCIRCGARSRKYIPLRFIKIITLVGSLVGLVFLLFAARAKQPEAVEIGGIDIMMNGALVELTGNITSLEENKEMNSLKFKLDDGTGEIQVNVYNKLDKFIEYFTEKNMPRLGDKITIVGAINETEKFGISLSLNFPERLEILKRFKAERIMLGGINDNDIGTIAIIQARVTKQKSKTTKSGTKIFTFTLDDGSGQIELTMFDADIEGLKPAQRELLKSGAGEFTATIRISQYQSKLQATIADFRSLKPAAAAAPTPAVEPIDPAAVDPAAETVSPAAPAAAPAAEE